LHALAAVGDDEEARLAEPADAEDAPWHAHFGTLALEHFGRRRPVPLDERRDTRRPTEAVRKGRDVERNQFVEFRAPLRGLFLLVGHTGQSAGVGVRAGAPGVPDASPRRMASSTPLTKRTASSELKRRVSSSASLS